MQACNLQLEPKSDNLSDRSVDTIDEDKRQDRKCMASQSRASVYVDTPSEAYKFFILYSTGIFTVITR